MKKFFVALSLLPFVTGTAFAQNGATAGNAAAGKEIWSDPAFACKNCHGPAGQGAFGPDLAGRGLDFTEFQQAVRKPWGIMPTFVEKQISDQQVADLTAYFASLPKNPGPRKWRVEAPAGAPPAQVALVDLGCAQCHGLRFDGPRGNMASVNADFEEFKDLVYNHTDAMPTQRKLVGNPVTTLEMGNFNRARVTEASLREIYNWAHDDLGFRVPLQARLSAGQTGTNGVTYTLNITNQGLPGKGLSAEGVTIRLQVPAGANVVSATGAGYQGVHMDAEAKANVAEWTVATIAPKDRQSYTITLSKAGTATDNLKGNIRWTRPGPKSGPNTDVVNIAQARL